MCVCVWVYWYDYNYLYASKIFQAQKAAANSVTPRCTHLVVVLPVNTSTTGDENSFRFGTLIT